MSLPLIAALLGMAMAQDSPAELEGWAPWIQARHPELGCARIGAERVCAWPGRLALNVTAEGASFEMDLVLDREQVQVLPGGPGAWPQAVLVGGLPAPVMQRDKEAVVRLSAGSHRLSGRIPWTQIPPTLALPADAARVELVLMGQPVPQPRLEPGGALVLGEAGERAAAAEDSVEMDVSRRVVDGVPLRVLTQIDIRAAGRGRELQLADVLLPGTRAVALSGGLPAHLREGDVLAIQLRPGAATLTIEAVHEGPALQLVAPKVGGADAAEWPAQEYWAVATDDTVRAVQISGAAAVDPARTPLPA